MRKSTKSNRPTHSPWNTCIVQLAPSSRRNTVRERCITVPSDQGLRTCSCLTRAQSLAEAIPLGGVGYTCDGVVSALEDREKSGCDTRVIGHQRSTFSLFLLPTVTMTIARTVKVRFELNSWSGISLRSSVKSIPLDDSPGFISTTDEATL